MNRTAESRAVVILLTIGLHATAGRIYAQTPSVVIQWNQLAQARYGAGASAIQRTLAILHIAMFDAINSIERVYTPYRVDVKASAGASAEAAAAQAAHDVLNALFPAQQATYDATLAAQLNGIPPGLVKQGVRVGQLAAAAILEWRANDGWPADVTITDPTYVLPQFPGLWQPTPPLNSFATFKFYPHVVPFALVSSTQFLPAPPPTLISPQYATDFNETKRVGSVLSEGTGDRTPEQTLKTQVFAGVNTSIGFQHVWNIVAGTLAQSQGFSLIDTARLFALLNVSLHDGLQTSFTSKFIYGLWRPVTAIRRAADDLNPDTAPDPAWTPLLATPPYPSYAGNASCIGAAGARALQLGFGRDDLPFSVTYPRTGGFADVTYSFTGFDDLAVQQARSRIYGGIHYEFDSTASRSACPKVAEWAFAHYSVPRK
jgi:hypothetical protein